MNQTHPKVLKRNWNTPLTWEPHYFIHAPFIYNLAGSCHQHYIASQATLIYNNALLQVTYAEKVVLARRCIHETVDNTCSLMIHIVGNQAPPSSIKEENHIAIREHIFASLYISTYSYRVLVINKCRWMFSCRWWSRSSFQFSFDVSLILLLFQFIISTMFLRIK